MEAGVSSAWAGLLKTYWPITCSPKPWDGFSVGMGATTHSLPSSVAFLTASGWGSEASSALVSMLTGLLRSSAAETRASVEERTRNNPVLPMPAALHTVRGNRRAGLSWKGSIMGYHFHEYPSVNSMVWVVPPA